MCPSVRFPGGIGISLSAHVASSLLLCEPPPTVSLVPAPVHLGRPDPGPAGTPVPGSPCHHHIFLLERRVWGSQLPRLVVGELASRAQASAISGASGVFSSPEAVPPVYPLATSVRGGFPSSLLPPALPLQVGQRCPGYRPGHRPSRAARTVMTGGRDPATSPRSESRNQAESQCQQVGTA